MTRRFSADHFPSTLRGHGITHAPYSIQQRHRRQPRCVQSGCRGGDSHHGKSENMDDWAEDHHQYSRRKEIARRKQRDADAAEVRKRGTYTPAPRIEPTPAYVPAVKCSSCGRRPSGEKNDEGLNLHLCGRCWRRGYALKHQDTHDDGTVVQQ